MRRVVAIGLLLLVCSRIFSQTAFSLFSPDSSLHVDIKAGEKLSYALYAGSQLLEGSSSIDLRLNNGQQLSGNIVITSKKTGETKEVITPPIPYRRKTILNRYNQLEIRFKKPFVVQFRLYNNGMAYRIGIKFRDSVFISDESALFEFDKQAEIWFAHIDKRPDQDRFHTSFEGVYKKEVLSAIADTMFTFAPVVALLPNGYRLAVTDANLIDYPGMFLQPSVNGLKGVFAPFPLKEEKTKGEFSQFIVTERANYLAKTSGNRMLPWRVVMVAKNDIELPANDMVYALADSSMIADPSWIKYGKGTDEWITGINLFNVPFEAGINTASYKYYIDFAKRFGFDQVMLDAGWSDYNDLFKINPGLDMDELVAYAKKNKIRLMLWTLCSTLDRQLDSALAQFNKWGVQSIMTDFMDRDDQPTVNFYYRIAKACADHKIAIMFHGAFPPKGLNRTWPNVITHEGVLGSEWNIWSELPTPEHNVAIAYTRMLAGPLDYEPGILLNAQKVQFRMVSKNPMSQGTRCQQLAMFVVYDSPLQIFSGNISQGLKEPDFMELLGSIPTTWDETKILQGKIGEYIVTARRKGEDWYVGALNNNVPRDIKLQFDFLNDGNYKTTICKDGLNAHNYASDYELIEKTFKKSDTVTIHAAPGGGFLIRLIKN